MKISPIITTLLALSTPLVCALPSETTTKAKPSDPDHAEKTNEKSELNDFINFVNDDTLHGKFMGFTTSGKVIWKNMAAEKNIAFTTEQVRKVVLNKGELNKPFTHTSYLTLTNQDTIPGAIIGLDEKEITLRTDYAGELKVPREVISSIDFLPLGDKIHYRGPFSKEDWQALSYDYNNTSNSADNKGKPAWELRNFALKNAGKSGVIMHKGEFSGKTRYTFKISYRSSVMPSFVINADMKKVEAKEKEIPKAAGNARVVSSRSANITEVVGTSLIFRLSNYSSSLSFYSFDDEGKPYTESIPNILQNNRSSRPKQDSSLFDVRVDKENDTVLLYSDNAMIGQWDISAYKEKLNGKKIGFANLYSSSANVSMVSEIVVSSWNGIIDPASSMENDDRDTILLSNGTDRYSGKALNLIENKLLLKAPYAELEIPTDQIQSLYFAKKNRRELPAKSDSEISLRFHGSGRLTGTLAKGPDGNIILDSGVLGKLVIQSEYVSSYEFEDMDYAYEILK